MLGEILESGNAANQNKLMTSIEEFKRIIEELDRDAVGKSLEELEVEHAPLVTMA